MWKSWILIALGSVLATQAVARGLVPADVEAAGGSANANSNQINIGPVVINLNLCASEIKKACGPDAKVEAEPSTIIINKKGTYQGTGNDRVDLINAMKSAVETLATPLPPAFPSLCANPVSNVQ